MKPVKSLAMKITLHYFVYSILFFFSHPAFAFGVLMTTPEERKILDMHRNKSAPVSVQTVKEAQIPYEPVIRIDGLVKRRNGPNSVWVDGALKQKTSASGVFIDATKLVDSAVLVKLSPESSPLLIKPGQRLNMDRGDVTEYYLETVRSDSEPVDGKTVDDKAGSLPDLPPTDVMTEAD